MDKAFPVLTATTGNNADILQHALSLYAKEGDTICDVTFGKGAFWKGVDISLFKFIPSDLTTGIDFRSLPHEEDSTDILVLDPPYMHGGATIKKSINDSYKNQNTTHESIIRLYAGGILEAWRVLKKKGKIFVKTQDETESGKQRFTHCEVLNLLSFFGFCVLDFFVLVQKGVPAMREKYQKSARKNHSYLIVGEKR